MKIIEATFSTVIIEDEQGYRSDVFQQSDKKWKCLRCQRYRCEHVKFVQAENPQLQAVPVVSMSDNEILTY